MIVRDLFTGGKRSFASTTDAREFRQTIYDNHGLVLPQHAGEVKPPQVCVAELRSRCSVAICLVTSIAAWSCRDFVKQCTRHGNLLLYCNPQEPNGR